MGRSWIRLKFIVLVMANRGYDLNKEDVAEYIKNLEIEYTYQCFEENLSKKEKAEGCHNLGDFMESVRRDDSKARSIYEKNCIENEWGKSCFKLGCFDNLGKGLAGGRDRHSALRNFDTACRYGIAQACHSAGLLMATEGVNLEKTDTDKNT